ncbi:MAG: hypothetical protein M3367_14545 [Acidobacteriota bacterium]|nr:hypothetical protein [Acidobacteriota bacterium]
MIAIEGIYDGKNFIALEKVTVSRKYKVIITFVEEIDEAENLRDFTAQTDSFEFWNNDEEDIYQDYLTVKGQ